MDDISKSISAQGGILDFIHEDLDFLGLELRDRLQGGPSKVSGIQRGSLR